MIDFVYPYKFQEILQDTTDNRYKVSRENPIKNMDERRHLRNLNDIETAIHQELFLIADHDRFDFLFYTIKQIEDKQDKSSIQVMKKCADILASSLSKIVRQIDQQAQAEDYEDIAQLRNSFKMILFLNFYFLQSTCVRNSKSSIKDQITNALQDNTNQKSKKRGGRNKEVSSDYLEEIFEKQINILNSIEQTLDVNTNFLFKNRPIDDEFYKYFVETAVKILESSQLLKQNPQLRNIIFKILEVVVNVKEEIVKNVKMKLINLIYEEESLLENVSDFILKAHNSTNTKLQKIAQDTLILLADYVNQKTNVNQESQAVKNSKEFFIKMAAHIPKLFQQNYSCFAKLFDNEAYHLRNAMSEIIASIIKNVLKVDQDQDLDSQEHNLIQKKKMLDTLITRIYDKHSYSRTCVIGILSDLAEDNVIPHDYLMPLLKCACDRIHDASSNVRKKAIKLLSMIIKFYYIIFVQSQEKTKFMKMSELDQEMEINKQEQKDYDDLLKAVDKNMRECQQDQFEDLEEEQNNLKKKLEQSKSYYVRLVEYQTMIKNLNQIMPNLLQLLGSKSIFDVQESIKFFLFLYKANIESSEEGIIKMQSLVWSKEKTIKEELLRTYWQLFFEPKEFTPKMVGKNLINLFKNANLTQLTSLEEILVNFMTYDKIQNNQQEQKGGDKDKNKNQIVSIYNIHKETFNYLWDTFIEQLENIQNSEDQQKRQEMRVALTIIRMASPHRSSIINHHKLLNLIEILKNFLKQKRPDFIIIREIAMVVEKVGDTKQESLNSFIKIFLNILIQFQGIDDTEYFCACQHVINMLFSVKNNSENLVQFLILKCTKSLIHQSDINIEFPKLTQRMQDDNEYNTPFKLAQEVNDEKKKSIIFEMKISHLLFIVGHAALKILIYVDRIEEELKILKQEGEKKQQEQNQESELDKIYGGIEAEYERKLEQLQQIAEETILNETNLLAFYKPWILKIVNDLLRSDQKDQRNVILDRVAVISLCKFMCVSKKFCEQNLDILFQILKSNCDSIIKTNIIISIGDLLHKYPNSVEKYTNQVYSNLHDEEIQVRKTTMMVLTHLILNDMMKIKGEICEVALLLEDPEHKIQNLVKLFLHELNKKDQKLIYNLLPEAIGRMSEQVQTGSGGRITETTFETFAKNFMPYLEKEKYSEILVEKLIQRFDSKNIKETKNSAYCLAQLAYNEKGIKKLIEMFDVYRSFLSTPYIREQFTVIQSKLQRIQKQDLKKLVEEWADKMENFNQENFDKKKDDISKKKKGKKVASEQKDQVEKTMEKTEKKVTRSAKQQNKNIKRNKNAMILESDEDEISEVSYDEEEEYSSEEEPVVKNKKNKVPPRRQQTKDRKGMMEEEESEESAEEDPVVKNKKNNVRPRRQLTKDRKSMMEEEESEEIYEG